MKEHKVGIIMNGVTGRMGTNQHLLRSIDAIIKEGGIKVSDDEIIMPDPVLVGRNEGRIAVDLVVIALADNQLGMGNIQPGRQLRILAALDTVIRPQDLRAIG